MPVQSSATDTTADEDSIEEIVAAFDAGQDWDVDDCVEWHASWANAWGANLAAGTGDISPDESTAINQQTEAFRVRCDDLLEAEYSGQPASSSGQGEPGDFFVPGDVCPGTEWEWIWLQSEGDRYTRSAVDFVGEPATCQVGAP